MHQEILAFATVPNHAKLGPPRPDRHAAATLQCCSCAQSAYEIQWDFELRHHIRRKHQNVYAVELFHAIVEPEPHACVLCAFKCYNKLGLHEHLKQEHVVNISGNDNENVDYEQFGWYPCDYCGFESYSSLGLVKHHDDQCKMIPSSCGTKPQNVADSNVMRHFSCAQCCSYKVKYKRDLKRHILERHTSPEEINWFKCEKCSYKAKRKDVLRTHNILLHAKGDEINWFRCSKCSYKTKRKRYLKNHALRRHLPFEAIKWYRCEKCSYLTKYNHYLKVHMKIHMNEFRCEKCTYITGNKKSFTSHIRYQHSRDQETNSRNNHPKETDSKMKKLKCVTTDRSDRFKCEKCSYAGKRKDSLQRHMLKHAKNEDIKWHSCSECPYRAKHKNNLKLHKLKHAMAEEIDWFKCTKCSFKGKQKHHLDAHMVLHTKDDEVNWLKCAKCIFTTKHKRSLSRHMLQHVPTEETEWFQCVQCSYKSIHKSHLKRHMSQHDAWAKKYGLQ